MIDWLHDPLNPADDPTRPTTRTILLRLCTPWPYITFGTAIYIDLGMRAAKIIDDTLGDLRP